MTSKQISIKLQEAGFKAGLHPMAQRGYWDNNNYISNYIATPHIDKDSFIPAYDTDTLLDWLKEWRSAKPERDVTIWMDSSIPTIEVEQYSKWIDTIAYTTSWSDLLAEAILFILKENQND